MNLQEIVRDHKEKIIVKDLEFSKTLKFQTEEGLIGWIKQLKFNENRSILQNRWDLGTVIVRFYDKEYGKDKLQKISDEVGYSKNTLHKACQFARNFTMEHLRTLIEGTVSLSWRDVAQNLTVDTEDFVKTYKNSKTIHEFRNAVTKFKLHGEVRGEMKPMSQSFKNGINLEYRWLMRNKIEYRDFQLNLKEQKIAELKDHIAELMAELAQYGKEMSKNKMADQIDDFMEQNLAAVAA